MGYGGGVVAAVCLVLEMSVVRGVCVWLRAGWG